MFVFSPIFRIQAITFLPFKVQVIDIMRFTNTRYCSNLTTLFLNKGIEKLYSLAFGDCENLIDVYFYSVIPLQSSLVTSFFLDENLFQNSHIEYATLHVPAGSVDRYKSAKVWKDFGKIVPLTDEETDIKTTENESITTSNYFLLNGQQANAAKKGINILKKGRKVIKVMVKQITPQRKKTQQNLVGKSDEREVKICKSRFFALHSQFFILRKLRFLTPIPYLWRCQR